MIPDTLSVAEPYKQIVDTSLAAEDLPFPFRFSRCSRSRGVVGRVIFKPYVQ